MMSRTVWRWVRPLSGAAILAVVLRAVGTGPFVTAYRLADGRSLVAAAGITVVTTVCCAARWSLVTRCLGVGVPLREAVPAYYRSQFLNTVLPGGVLGDVHRAVGHGVEVGDVNRTVRAVAWERTAGQGVQLVLTSALLLLLPSPWRSVVPLLAAGLLAGALVAVLVTRALPRGGTSLPALARRTVVDDLRTGLLERPAWSLVVLASTAAVAGHVSIFVIAARTAGSTASIVRLLPLALIVLLAAAVPMNIAGWGPREGIAAWAFAGAGLSAAQGVATAVLYGVLVFAASLPGALVLLASGWRRSARARAAARPPQLWPPASGGLEGAPRG
jgi:uncharacterized membrane protein YbhN (UPF0104 family)